MNVVFLAISVSMFSGFFSLWAVSFLYLRYQTVILRLILTFLASLVLINLGSWLGHLERLIATLRVWNRETRE